MTPERENNEAGELQTINERLAKIEKFLWPPIEPGGKPPGPTDPPPFGPMDMGKQLKALADRLDDLDSRAATKQEMEDLRDEIVELNRGVTALNEVYQTLALHMPTPM